MNEREQRWPVYQATFDTNIFVRKVLVEDNLPNLLISLWLEDRFILVLSQPIIDEVERVLSRRDLRRKYQNRHDKVTDLIDLLGQARIIEVNDTYDLSQRDPKDNMLVDCAIVGRVQFLVSTDKDLIDNPELKRALFEHGVSVVDPQDFLSVISVPE